MLLDASGDGFQSLVSVTRNADDDRFITWDPPVFDKFLGDGNLGSASGLREDAFGLSEQLDAAENFLVRDAFAPTARLADRLDDVVAIRRIADGDRAGDGIGLDRTDEVGALVQRVNNRRAAGRLRWINLTHSCFGQPPLGHTL